MDIIGYLSLLFAPAIAVLIIIYMKYKVPDISIHGLIKAFLWGMLSILLLMAVQALAANFGLDNLRSLRRIIFYSLVILAFFSELGKYIVLRLLYYPRSIFRTPVDGILYSVLIAMGFATAAGILSLLGYPGSDIYSINGFTAAPANIVFGTLMGFFLGLGKLRKLRFIDSMTGLSGAVFFHALYSFCLLTNDHKLLTAFFIGSALMIFSLSVAAVRISIDANREEKRA